MMENDKNKWMAWWEGQIPNLKTAAAAQFAKPQLNALPVSLPTMLCYLLKCFLKAAWPHLIPVITSVALPRDWSVLLSQKHLILY